MNRLRKKREKLLYTYKETISPAIHRLSSLPKGPKVWNYRENAARKLAEETTTSHAISSIFYHDIDITHIDGWRIYAERKEQQSTSPVHFQVQYQAHYAPMIIEKWALPLFKQANLVPDNVSPAARTDVECACCQVCNYYQSYENGTLEHPLPDVYVMYATGSTIGNA